MEGRTVFEFKRVTTIRNRSNITLKREFNCKLNHNDLKSVVERRTGIRERMTKLILERMEVLIDKEESSVVY